MYVNLHDTDPGVWSWTFKGLRPVIILTTRSTTAGSEQQIGTCTKGIQADFFLIKKSEDVAERGIN